MTKTEEYKYVDEVMHAVEEALYHACLHIRIDRDPTTHVWRITYEEHH